MSGHSFRRCRRSARRVGVIDDGASFGDGRGGGNSGDLSSNCLVHLLDTVGSRGATRATGSLRRYANSAKRGPSRAAHRTAGRAAEVAAGSCRFEGWPSRSARPPQDAAIPGFRAGAGAGAGAGGIGIGGGHGGRGQDQKGRQPRSYHSCNTKETDGESFRWIGWRSAKVVENVPENGR